MDGCLIFIYAVLAVWLLSWVLTGTTLFSQSVDKRTKKKNDEDDWDEPDLDIDGDDDDGWGD